MIVETYLPKTLKYCIDNNIEVLPHNEGHEENIYIPCYLMIIRYGYHSLTENNDTDKLNSIYENIIKYKDINKYIDYIYTKL